jgi:hypothetical protein
MSNLQLHFNGNFPFKKIEIRRILQAATEEKGLNDSLENLMARTSLGNAKVGRIKSWATRAGLIQNHRPTPEGEMIWRIDPDLESDITDWLMHFYLSFGDKGLQKLADSPAAWGGWPYLVYVFLPEHPTFTATEFIEQADSVFKEDYQVIARRVKFIFRAYTEPQALAACKFLVLENSQYRVGYSRLPNSYLLGYFLAKLWERDFQSEGSVLTESILNQKMGLAPVLGINPETLQGELNSLEAYGIIEQRRAVPPFQIIPRWDNPLVLLEKAYEYHR